MSTLAIIQARWGSSRCPGKVMEQLGPAVVLEHVVRRVQAAVRDVVVAVPNQPRDGRIVLFCAETLQVPAFLWDGPEHDVLGRFVACAAEHKPDLVVRVTADCPLLDPDMVALCVETAQQTAAPYVTNVPIGQPSQVDGHDVEVFTRDLLAEADRAARHDSWREHPTTYMRQFAPWRIVLDRHLPLPGARWQQHRWTLDTMADLAWLRWVASELDLTPPANPTWQLAELLTKRPDMARYTHHEREAREAA